VKTLGNTTGKIGRGLLTQVALVCALPLTMAAQNLLPNGGFERRAAGVSPGTPVSYTTCDSYGPSAAAVWTVWLNTCGTEITTTLVPSTAVNGGNYMMHVVTTGANNGLVIKFSGAAQTSSTLSVFVNSGCVGMGTGDGSYTADTDGMTCLTGQWVTFTKVPNAYSPANEFVVYSVVNPQFLTGGGADFYVDNGRIVAVP